MRCALFYMATLSAKSVTPLTAFCEEFCAPLAGTAGKKPLVALTASMRKLVVLMNHLLKNENFQLAS